jgi:hypothetical protein
MGMRGTSRVTKVGFRLGPPPSTTDATFHEHGPDNWDDEPSGVAECLEAHDPLRTHGPKKKQVVSKWTCVSPLHPLKYTVFF